MLLSLSVGGAGAGGSWRVGARVPHRSQPSLAPQKIAAALAQVAAEGCAIARTATRIRAL